MSYGSYNYYGGARSTTRSRSRKYGRTSSRGSPRDVRFTNDWDTPTHVRWNGRPYGDLDAGEVVRVDTYPGHTWQVLDQGTGRQLSEFTIHDDRSNYKFSRYSDEYANHSRKKRSKHRRKKYRDEYDYDYDDNTTRDTSYESIPWVNSPRGPCIHHIWEAGHIGNRQRTPSGHTLVTTSTHPRVFTIKNFLSPSECDHIIDLAEWKGFEPSTVSGGGGGSNFSATRTSSTAWLGHYASREMSDIFERAAALLQINTSELHRCAEDLQVVHYGRGQKNGEHHDYLGLGYRGNDRLLTLLFYLKDADEYGGGYTQFYYPNIKVKGNKGDAVLFYNMHPDGNHDVESLHAGTPITSGEKYIANFWVWDTCKE